jgi:predicted DNA-binding antitoxin AbrB/MazE fold protein
MSKTVTAIYENGVFRPLKKVRLHEHERVELSISKENELNDTTKTALSIIGIGKSSVKDSAEKHDEY